MNKCKYEYINDIGALEYDTEILKTIKGLPLIKKMI